MISKVPVVSPKAWIPWVARGAAIPSRGAIAVKLVSTAVLTNGSTVDW